jgi:hypothetical protein
MGCELVIRIIDTLEIDDHSLENYNFNLGSKCFNIYQLESSFIIIQFILICHTLKAVNICEIKQNIHRQSNTVFTVYVGG